MLLDRLLADQPFPASYAMRLRIGTRIRYPDVVVCTGPLDQTTRTLTDAEAIFEVLSDDTATTDRVDKLIDDTAVPSLRCYVLPEQTAPAAILFHREPGGAWIASAHLDGALILPGLDLTLPLADLYQGRPPGLGTTSGMPGERAPWRAIASLPPPCPTVPLLPHPRIGA